VEFRRTAVRWPALRRSRSPGLPRSDEVASGYRALRTLTRPIGCHHTVRVMVGEHGADFDQQYRPVRRRLRPTRRARHTTTGSRGTLGASRYPHFSGGPSS
jgi:hypothetical protein